MSPLFNTLGLMAISTFVILSNALTFSPASQSLTSPNQMDSDKLHNSDTGVPQSKAPLTISNANHVSVESASSTDTDSFDTSDKNLSAEKLAEQASSVEGDSDQKVTGNDVNDVAKANGAIDDNLPTVFTKGPVKKRSFDSIHTSSAFSGFGKRMKEWTDDEELSNLQKRRFDSIGNSAFTGFGKRRFDSIGNSAFTGFGKRRFDSIGNSAFTGFGKRAFDSIGSSAFTGFGKRQFDSIGSSAFTGFGKRGSGSAAEKRSFDSIGDSAFTGFGKRHFDSIGNSAFTGFGKRAFDSIGSSAFTGFGKRQFDSIGSSAFTGFGKRNTESENQKRAFDSIGNSAFTGFGKRRFDSIGNSAFTGFGKRDKNALSEKRAFDSIGNSAFTGFGKRRFDSIGNSAFTGFGKRSFDSIGNSAFNGFGKRRFDSIGNSAFSGFGKRRFDSIGNSAFTGFGKRAFDSIGSSAFTGFGKRCNEEGCVSESVFASEPLKKSFDSISSGSAFHSFGKRDSGDEGHQDVELKNTKGSYSRTKRDTTSSLSSDAHKIVKRNTVGEGDLTLSLTKSGADDHKTMSKRSFDSIDTKSLFRQFGKRRFDSIDRSSAFSSFGKRPFDSIGNSAFAGFGKRRFDSIGSSAFAGFGKRHFDSISGNSPFHSFGKRKIDSIAHQRVPSDLSGDDLVDLVKFVESLKDDEVSALTSVVDDIEASPEQKADIMLGLVKSSMHSAPTTGSVQKRVFDSIDNRSSFRRFGRSFSSPSQNFNDDADLRPVLKSLHNDFDENEKDNEASLRDILAKFLVQLGQELKKIE